MGMERKRMIEAILGLVTIIAGVLAEGFRRKWKHEEERANSLAIKYAQALQDYHGANSSGDGSIVFNDPD